MIWEKRDHKIEEILRPKPKKYDPLRQGEEAKENDEIIEDMEFEMDDITDNLRTTSILLEVVENISNLRENMGPIKDRDKELKHVIK